MPNDDSSSDAEDTVPFAPSSGEHRSEQTSRIDPTLLVLRQIGDYELLSEVARGGMGVVYRALQANLNRIVALKIMRHSNFASNSDRERFRLEAEAAATLSHPNIVPIYEVGEDENVPYYTMRLINGPSLAQAMGAGEWQPNTKAQVRKIVQLMVLVCDAVHDAHLHGIIHRDLKPGNILLDGNATPYVTDFGLAKRIERQDGLTLTDAFMGTPAFMAPEQISSAKTVTVATDIYSLGAIIYSLLAGRPPLSLATPAEAIRQLIHEIPTGLAKVNHLVDRDLQTIVQKCLEKDPKRRYSSASILRDDLQRWLSNEPIQARPTGKIERFIRWSKRHPLRLGLVAMACLVLVMTTGTLYLGYSSTVRMLRNWQDSEYDRLLLRAAFCEQNNDSLGLVNALTAAAQNREELQESTGWEWHYLNRKCPIELQIPSRSEDWTGCAWSDDGLRFAVSENNNDLPLLTMWKVDLLAAKGDHCVALRHAIERAPGRTIRIPAINSKPSMISWQPGGKLFALQADNLSVNIYDSDTGKLVRKVPSKVVQKFPKLKWCHSGQKLAVVGKSSIVVADLSQQDQCFTFAKAETGETEVYWDHKDEQLILAHAKTSFHDTSTGEVTKTWPFRTSWSVDGHRWSSANGFGDWASDSVQLECKLGKAVWSPNGNYVLCRQNTGMEVIDTTTGALVSRWDLTTDDGVGWFPNSERFMLGRFVMRPLDWQLANFEQPLKEPIAHLSVSPNEELLALVPKKKSGLIEISNVDSSTSAELIASKESIERLSWSPDSQLLATMDRVGTVSIWDAQTQKLIWESKDLQASKVDAIGYQLKWSSDGQFLAASFNGSRVIVWQASEFNEVYRLNSYGLRVVDWIEEPQALVMETYIGSMQDERKHGKTGNDLDGKMRTITWEPKSRLTYESTTKYVSNNSQLLSRTNSVVGTHKKTFVVHTLDTPWHPTAAWQSDEKIQLPNGIIQMCAANENCFLLSENGCLYAFAPQRKRIALPLPRTSPNATLCAVNDHLWVAEGERILLYDGSISTSSSVKLQLRDTNGMRSFNWNLMWTEKLCLIFLVTVAPIWLLVDPGVKLSSSRRWLVAAAVAAAGLAIWLASNSGTLIDFVWVFQTQILFSVWLTIVFTIFAIGSTAAVVESIRLLTTSARIVPVFTWLTVVAVLLVQALVQLWPSGPKSVLNIAMLRSTLVIAFFVVGALLFLVRYINWSVRRGDSRKFLSAPRWVRFWLVGYRTLPGAFISAIFGKTIGFAFIYVGVKYYLLAEQRMLNNVGILVLVGGCLMVVSTGYTLLACWWVKSRGGWKAQLQKPGEQ